ncbi:hypothetical protein Q9R08_04735 [Microbacterium sp. QXD-8]|uniref:Uncharacterized protein n=1 Tax=Microbacterium psychrotolerans TaxID=3068321 RepID=A0ABU0YZT8_9MICO|nr:hypothetical protein [Microbacterium sp. QXD-8]MDQ7877278.1 hypothetical protein [Microbacterium sp. QXD-8]
MGLFSQLPEEPAEWAGLPSEPERTDTQAERLAEAAAVDLGGLGVGDVGLGAAPAVESIVIPVAPVIEIAESQESGEDA